MTPRSDVSAERRAQIIEAALACFCRKGFSHTTMDDIVAESGLSKGALYWYFDSKEDLFVTAINTFLAEWGQESMSALASYETAAEKLRAGGQELAAFCRRSRELFALFVEFLSQSEHSEEAGRSWIDVLVKYQQVVTGIVQEGIDRGEFRPVDAGQLVWAVMAAYDGLAAYALLMPDMDVDGISQVFIETLLRGLASRMDGYQARVSCAIGGAI